MKRIDPGDDPVVDDLVSMSLALAERKLSARSNRSTMDRESEERNARRQRIPQRGDDHA
jgi:hypothetical protein